MAGGCGGGLTRNPPADKLSRSEANRLMEQTSGLEFFLCVLGVVFILEGLPYFAFPAQIKQYLAKVTEIPDRTLRILGMAAIVTGLLLVYFGRR